jgi:hypothetical protein
MYDDPLFEAIRQRARQSVLMTVGDFRKKNQRQRKKYQLEPLCAREAFLGGLAANNSDAVAALEGHGIVVPCKLLERANIRELHTTPIDRSHDRVQRNRRRNKRQTERIAS